MKKALVSGVTDQDRYRRKITRGSATLEIGLANELVELMVYNDLKKLRDNKY